MRHHHLVEVRPVNDADQARQARFGQPPHASSEWVAVDSAGRLFGGATEEDARAACEHYNATRRKSR